MINSNEINKRQNETKMLKIQYAARVCFNSAEKLNRWSWIFCIMAAFSVFIPQNCSGWITKGVPIIADIAAFVCLWKAENKIKWASKLRKYLDSYVLGLRQNQFSKTESQEIYETTYKICEKNHDETEIQISNTGKEKPPGVRDWYNCSNYYEGLKAQFECQKQNIWWNSKLMVIRIYIILFGLIICLVVFHLFLINTNMNLLDVLACFIGIIVRIFERGWANYKYFDISESIKGAQKVVEASPTLGGIQQLQDFIDEQRAINVLEYERLHERLSRYLSKLYEAITLDKN